METTSFGGFIRERRDALGFSLKDLGAAVPKENGKPISAQYLHDIEKDRRMPGAYVFKGLAVVLGVDVNYLRARAGFAPESVSTYLRKHPDAAVAVDAMFARAAGKNYTSWAKVAA